MGAIAWARGKNIAANRSGIRREKPGARRVRPGLLAGMTCGAKVSVTERERGNG
jgi:hypothetical protein